jgi:hypothetical protein
MSLALSLSLGIDKRRGNEEPVPVLRADWAGGELPSRADFFDSIERAYRTIELPFVPSGAWVVVETARRRETVAAAEPVDEPYVIGLALWNGVLGATTG